jgi:hypothetical protein
MAAAKPAQVFQDVKLPLVGPAQAFAGVEAGTSAGAGQPLHVAKAGAVGGIPLLSQLFRLAVGRQKQVAVEAAEVAGYVFLPGNALNLVDGGLMAFGGQLRSFRPKQVFQGGVAVVEGKGQVGSGAATFAAGQLAVFEYQHLAPGLAQQVGGGEAGDTRAHNHYVGAGIFA